MNLGELAFHQKQMAAAGWSGDQIADFAAWAAEWRADQVAAQKERRLDRRLLAAVDVALFPDVVVPVSDEKGDEFVPVFGKMSRKHVAARAVNVAPGFAPQTRAVLGAIIGRANSETGLCSASRTTLAADAHITCVDAERAVSRAIREIERSLLIVRRPGGGRTLSSSYIVQWDRFAVLLAEVEGPPDQRRMPAALGRLKGDKLARRNGDNGDGIVSQTHIDISTSVLGERVVTREPRQLELRVHQVVAGTDARQQALERVEASLRGKYRDHEMRKAMTVGLVGLSDTERNLVTSAELDDRTGLKTLEAILGRGPPRSASGG